MTQGRKKSWREGSEWSEWQRGHGEHRTLDGGIGWDYETRLLYAHPGAGQPAAVADTAALDALRRKLDLALYGEERAQPSVEAGRSSAEPVADIETQAWECDKWPVWLHSIVDRTNEVADRLDMSTEQAHAYAALAALAHTGAGQPAAVNERAMAAAIEAGKDFRPGGPYSDAIRAAVVTYLSALSPSGNDLRKRVVGNPYKANAEFREDTP